MEIVGCPGLTPLVDDTKAVLNIRSRRIRLKSLVNKRKLCRLVEVIIFEKRHDLAARFAEALRNLGTQAYAIRLRKSD